MLTAVIAVIEDAVSDPLIVTGPVTIIAPPCVTRPVPVVSVLAPLTVTAPLAVSPDVAVIKPDIVGVAVQPVGTTVSAEPVSVVAYDTLPNVTAAPAPWNNGPFADVVNVGAVPNTSAPVPVSSVIAVARLADVSDRPYPANVVGLVPDVTRPLASVVTERYVPAVPTLPSVNAPALVRVASPDMATAAAWLELLPTQIFVLASVDPTGDAPPRLLRPEPSPVNLVAYTLPFT